MGFLSGSTTFQRYWITGDPTPALGPEHLDTLERYAIGQFETESPEQPDVGFIAGDHLLDTHFELAKNVIGSALHFGIRIDTNKIPAAIRNAWYQMELLPLTADTPNKRPSKGQREEAKSAVESRCREGARSGKYRRLAQVPMLWDTEGGILYVGSSSEGANALCIDLLERAFELELDQITSGKLADSLADNAKERKLLGDMTPSQFHAQGASPGISWWNGQSGNYDYLGNEFLLWLWWYWETQSDTLQLPDESEVAGMFSRTLNLECPLGETGKETITSLSPTRLPEAMLGIRSGKLPRKAGLTLARYGQQYDLTIHAETLSIQGARIRLGEDSDSENHRQDHLGGIFDLSDTIDQLFGLFFERRLSPAWSKELKSIRNWIQATSRAQRKPAA